MFYAKALCDATMGDDGLFSHSLEDSDNIVTNYMPWINQLGQQFLASNWQTSDPAASSDWSTDFQALVARFQAAKDSDTNASSTVGLPRSLTYDNDVYNNLLLAIRQGGEGSPVQKGDFLDLRDRLQTYLQSQPTPTSVTFSPPVQPSVGKIMQFYKATAPADVIAMLKGEQAPKGVFDKNSDAGKTARTWVKLGFIFGGITIVGYTAGNVARLIRRG